MFVLRLVPILCFVAFIQVQSLVLKIEDNPCTGHLSELCDKVQNEGELTYVNSESNADNETSTITCKSHEGLVSCALNNKLWFSCNQNASFLQLGSRYRNGDTVNKCALAERILKSFSNGEESYGGFAPLGAIDKIIPSVENITEATNGLLSKISGVWSGIQAVLQGIEGILPPDF